MARDKFSSPTLHVEITEEAYATAKASKSGGCLIADAIKQQHPHLSGVIVDMATIRASDKKLGVRYTWLTPETGQYVLLAYDQGWKQPYTEVKTKRAVKITPITASKARGQRKVERLAELEAKEAEGALIGTEKAALTKLRSTPVRPPARGKPEVRLDDAHGQKAVVVGGEPILQGKPHPNLLRGSDRHFGAKLADAGVAFNEAVEEAVAQRLAEMQEPGVVVVSEETPLPA